MAGDPGTAFVTPAVPNDPETPTAALWRLFPTTAPQDESTTDLVYRLRDEVLPNSTQGTGLDIAVSGGVAAAVDFSEYLTARLPLFIGVVLGLSFLLLMLVFRSLLVPLKAVVMNLLDRSGLRRRHRDLPMGLVRGRINIESAPIEPFVPMMMFAILFGLSMDYEVFLLSRIREEYVRTGDSRLSVADGLASTARAITAAAAIMVVVFGSFIGESDRIVKLFGVGLSIAVLLDATIVRMLLVPATMELLGDANWWLPRWLDRAMPRVAVEGHPRGATARARARVNDRQPEPSGKVALVAGATRGADAPSRSSWARPALTCTPPGVAAGRPGDRIDRPETIEETGELVAAGGSATRWWSTTRTPAQCPPSSSASRRITHVWTYSSTICSAATGMRSGTSRCGNMTSSAGCGCSGWASIHTRSRPSRAAADVENRVGREARTCRGDD